MGINVLQFKESPPRMPKYTMPSGAPSARAIVLASFLVLGAGTLFGSCGGQSSFGGGNTGGTAGTVSSTGGMGGSGGKAGMAGGGGIGVSAGGTGGVMNTGGKGGLGVNTGGVINTGGNGGGIAHTGGTGGLINMGGKGGLGTGGMGGHGGVIGSGGRGGTGGGGGVIGTGGKGGTGASTGGAGSNGTTTFSCEGGGGAGASSECVTGRTFCHIQAMKSAPATAACESFSDSTRIMDCSSNPSCACLCTNALYFHCQTDCTCTESNGQVTVTCSQT